MLFTSLTVYSKLLQLLVSLDVTAESIFHLLYSSSLRRLLVALQPLTSLHGSARGPLPLLVPPLRSPRRLGVVHSGGPSKRTEIRPGGPVQSTATGSHLHLLWPRVPDTASRDQTVRSGRSQDPRHSGSCTPAAPRRHRRAEPFVCSG